MKCILITKPIRIIGEPNSVLEITEGPISINISENYENEVVKFSQIKINFNVCQSEKSMIKNFKSDQTKFTVLFRLYPGSLLELEDCDITCNKDINVPIAKHKLICFQLLYCKYFRRNDSNLNLNSENILNSDIIFSNQNTNSPTILTIISSRIEKFYQTIRSAENCIINIEKSYITKNIGKSLCVLNPLILKVVESTFEGNLDNSIHVKFVKDENLIHDSRKLFFKNNEISYNHGTGIYLDGIEHFMLDLDINIENNTFKKNKCDCIFMLDLYVKSLLISNNKFMFGKSNGLNLNKIYNKSASIGQGTNSTMTSLTQDAPIIEIKDNEFNENEGFGIFMNDSRAKIFNNNFYQNRGCGLLLISISIGEGAKTNSNQVINLESIKEENSPHNLTRNNFSNQNIQVNQVCYLQNNSFIKNGGSGLRIINYSHFISAINCYFSENLEFGIHIEVENSPYLINNINNNAQVSIISQEKIKSFKNLDNTKIPKETNLFLQNCTISNNMKSGIFINNCFVFLENTIINDNLDNAIYIPKEEFRYCFKQSKNSQKNLIKGNIGGPWGEINSNFKMLCNGCSSTSKIKRNNEKIQTVDNVVYTSNSGNSNLNNNNKINNNSNNNSNNKKANSDNSNTIKKNNNEGKCLFL